MKFRHRWPCSTNRCPPSCPSTSPAVALVGGLHGLQSKAAARFRDEGAPCETLEAIEQIVVGGLSAVAGGDGRLSPAPCACFLPSAPAVLERRHGRKPYRPIGGKAGTSLIALLVAYTSGSSWVPAAGGIYGAVEERASGLVRFGGWVVLSSLNLVCLWVSKQAGNGRCAKTHEVSPEEGGRRPTTSRSPRLRSYFVHLRIAAILAAVLIACNVATVGPGVVALARACVLLRLVDAQDRATSHHSGRILTEQLETERGKCVVAATPRRAISIARTNCVIFLLTHRER